MNILISGVSNSIALPLAKRFLKDKDRVVITSECLEKPKDLEGVIWHSIYPWDDKYHIVLNSYKFDMIIYLPAREEDLLTKSEINPGQFLSGLLNTLKWSSENKIRNFFYISSTEVYGKGNQTSEISQPQPETINGRILLSGEEYCQYYRDAFDLNTTIIRIPNVYGNDSCNCLLNNFIKKCIASKRVDIPYRENKLLNFIHILDIYDLILNVINEEIRSEQTVINLSADNSITFSKLAEMLGYHFTQVKINFEPLQEIYTQPAEVFAAKNFYHWIAMHDLQAEWETIINSVTSTPVLKKRRTTKIKEFFSKNREPLKWIELILGAILMQVFVETTDTFVQFKLLDIRLLFIILMGSIYGIKLGLLASLLASFSMLYSWNKLGLDWPLLIYNVENWLLFTLYFVAGSITGYVKDKKGDEIEFYKEENRLIDKKYGFLYDVYDNIRTLKDQFRQQLLGYRDSFGRIYNITRELDTLREEDVIYRALLILEDVLSNHTIAIYSLHQNNSFARLEASSQSIAGKTSKSLNLNNFPALTAAIEKKLVFQNNEMLLDYPIYCAPVYNEDQAVAMILVWEASFEQITLYYLNLLKVMSGLIQSALVRATIYLNANIQNNYLPGTKILTPESFAEILNIKYEMKKNKVSDFQLLRVNSNNKPVELYEQISKGIRNTDYVGMMKDNHVYILLSQADRLYINKIINRLEEFGVECDRVFG